MPQGKRDRERSRESGFLLGFTILKRKPGVVVARGGIISGAGPAGAGLAVEQRFLPGDLSGDMECSQGSVGHPTTQRSLPCNTQASAKIAWSSCHTIYALTKTTSPPCLCLSSVLPIGPTLQFFRSIFFGTYFTSTYWPNTPAYSFAFINTLGVLRL